MNRIIRFLMYLFVWMSCLGAVSAHALPRAVQRDLVNLEKKALEAYYGYFRAQRGQFKGSGELEPEIKLTEYVGDLPGFAAWMDTLDDESRDAFQAKLNAFDQALEKTEQGMEALEEASNMDVDDQDEANAVRIKKRAIQDAYAGAYAIQDKAARDQAIKNAYADLANTIKKYLIQSGALAVIKPRVGPKPKRRNAIEEFYARQPKRAEPAVAHVPGKKGAGHSLPIIPIEQERMMRKLKEQAGKKVQDDELDEDIDIDALEQRLRQHLGDEDASPEKFQADLKSWLYSHIGSLDLSTILEWVQDHPFEALMAVTTVYFLIAKGFKMFPFNEDQGKQEEEREIVQPLPRAIIPAAADAAGAPIGERGEKAGPVVNIPVVADVAADAREESDVAAANVPVAALDDESDEEADLALPQEGAGAPVAVPSTQGTSWFGWLKKYFWGE